MRLVAGRASTFVLSASLLVSLSACADKAPNSGMDTSSISAESTPAIDDIVITPIIENDPGSSKDTTEITPIEELPAEVRAKLPVAPSAGPAVEADHAHREDTTFSGKLPEGFTIPASGKLFEPASVIDGDRSYIALEFNQEWEQVAQTLKDSLTKDGWECVLCQNFTAVKNTAGSESMKSMKSMKYMMNMTNGTRSLYVIVTVGSRGTSAGLNFQP